jgi:hypothetical protein
MRHDWGLETPEDIPDRPKQHFILASESAAEFDRLRKIWYGEYSPSDTLEHEFVERLVEADWRRQRAARCLMLVEERLFSKNLDLSQWSDHDRRDHALAQRYAKSVAQDFEHIRRQLNDQRRVRMLQVTAEYHAHGSMVKDREFFPDEVPPGPPTRPAADVTPAATNDRKTRE